MAYMSQEHKQQIKAELKKVVPAGWKWSLSVLHHSTICMTIQSAPVDLLAEIVRVGGQHRISDGHALINLHWLESHLDASLPIFEALSTALNLGNWDRSDSQTDYFDVGHYVRLEVGRWDRPFKVIG